MNKQENPHRVKNNMTHLVFYITEEENQSFVFELEEDEYYFKKHVIVLNYEEINDFNYQFKNSQFQSYQLFFENTVDDNSYFENYKKNRSKNYYSMILKFYIKIPSLYLSKSVSSSELQTLKESIEKELEEINLLDFSNQLNEVMDSYIALGEELKTLNIETLNKWIGEIKDEK
nr:ABC-three component system middle component 1 [Enterococcus villorum]